MSQTITQEYLSTTTLLAIENILKAINVLALNAAKVENNPERYAKYGYDFSQMISVKVVNLREQAPNNYWVHTLSISLLHSLDSPKEIIDMCTQHLEELRQGIV